jgi:ATP-dependent Zn protease
VLGDEQGRTRVEEILTAGRQRVATVLHENRDVVVALRDALIARDELVGDEILQEIEIALSARN